MRNTVVLKVHYGYNRETKTVQSIWEGKHVCYPGLGFSGVSDSRGGIRDLSDLELREVRSKNWVQASIECFEGPPSEIERQHILHLEQKAISEGWDK